MKYLIGIDSGGSKTETLLFDETGHVLVRDLDQGANGMDIGKERAQAIILGALRRVMAQSPEPVCQVFGGIVGTSLGNFMWEHLRANLPSDVAVQVEGDGGIIMSGTIGHRDGCTMISGTGCSMFVRHGDQPLIKIGGWGYLVDAWGSGYGLGRDALAAAFRAYDGRGGATLLLDMVNEQLGKSVHTSIPDIYSHPAGTRAFIAKFAHLIIKARNQGDEIATRIYEQHTDALADMTYAAQRFFPDQIFPIVMNGGIFQAFPEYTQSVRDKANPNAQMILAQMPPVYGSMIEAMWHAGLPINEQFKENFLVSYEALCKTI